MDLSGFTTQHIKFIKRITLDGFTMRNGEVYSYQTGYAMGTGAPEITSYIEEFIDP